VIFYQGRCPWLPIFSPYRAGKVKSEKIHFDTPFNKIEHIKRKPFGTAAQCDDWPAVCPRGRDRNVKPTAERSDART